MFHFSYNRTRHVSQRMNGVVIASKRMHDTISQLKPWPVERFVVFGPHDEQCDPNGGC